MRRVSDLDSNIDAVPGLYAEVTNDESVFAQVIVNGKSGIGDLLIEGSRIR
jgi:hypothetical protein